MNDHPGSWIIDVLEDLRIALVQEQLYETADSLYKAKQIVVFEILTRHGMLSSVELENQQKLEVIRSLKN